MTTRKWRSHEDLNPDSPGRSRRPILLADATNWRRRGESNSLSNALQARPWPFWHFAVLVREAGFEPASFRFRAGCATNCATLDQIWFGKLDSNPRLKASKARMLPLHHSRMNWSGRGVPPSDVRLPRPVLFYTSFALMARTGGFEPPSSIQLPLSRFVAERVTCAKLAPMAGIEPA